MTPVIAGSINRTPTRLHRRCDMFIDTRQLNLRVASIGLGCAARIGARLSAMGKSNRAKNGSTISLDS
jgi:hypothetical protein